QVGFLDHRGVVDVEDAIASGRCEQGDGDRPPEQRIRSLHHRSPQKPRSTRTIQLRACGTVAATPPRYLYGRALSGSAPVKSVHSARLRPERLTVALLSRAARTQASGSSNATDASRRRMKSPGAMKV